MTDTANLVAQARQWNGTGSARDTAELFIDLADALEAAEQTQAELGSDLRDAQREVEVLTTALEVAEERLEQAEIDTERKVDADLRARMEAAEAERDGLREALEAIERRSLAYGHSAIARAALTAGSGDE